AANNANNNANGRVPSGRTVNGKPLSGDIALNSADVGAYSKGETDKHVNDAKALANAAQTAANNANNNANGRVPSGRTVNGKPLSGDIALNSADVGAYSKGETYSRGEVDSRVNDIRNVANTAQTAANNANNNANGRVPAGRKVNGKPLSSDIALSATDVGAYSKGETDKHVNDAKALANAAQTAANNANNNANGRVPSGRTVNGKPLAGDIALNAADVGAYSKGETYSRGEIDSRVTDVRNVANAAQATANNANNNANGRVPSGRKVNGKSLTGDIALNAADIGAYSKGETYSRGETDSRVTDVRNVANNAQAAANNANNNASNRLEKSQNGADIPNKEAFINNLGLAEARNRALDAVPGGRTVNGKPLTGNVWLGAADVGAYSKGETYSRGEVDARVNDVRNVANNVNKLVVNTVGGMRLSETRVHNKGSDRIGPDGKYSWRVRNRDAIDDSGRLKGEVLLNVYFRGGLYGNDAWEKKRFAAIQYFMNGQWVNIADDGHTPTAWDIERREVRGGGDGR
ncbi:hypothetical protein J8V46_05145, partial [Xenorhabdus sp. PB30.3]|nr:hypothetical protein [Xenorhabdus sp. PB30.3]